MEIIKQESILAYQNDEYLFNSHADFHLDSWKMDSVDLVEKPLSSGGSEDKLWGVDWWRNLSAVVVRTSYGAWT